MSEPNQKRVMIDKTQNLKSNFLRIDNDFIKNAYNRLSHTGFGVYLYLVTAVPHTYDGTMQNKKRTTTKPFDLSPQAISNDIGKHPKSIRTAIDELIRIGYLTLIQGNIYQFKDYLPEDKILTSEEYEQIKELTIEDSLKFQKEKRLKELENIKDNYFSDNTDIEPMINKKYDWE